MIRGSTNEEGWSAVEARGLRDLGGGGLTRFESTTCWLSLLLFLSVVACGSGEPVQEPTPLYGEVPIEYPIDLWDADVEGVTMLRVRVTEMGAVDSVEVLEGSGYPAFDSAAVRGALQLRYNPARRKGERTTVWAQVPVQFTKEGG